MEALKRVFPDAVAKGPEKPYESLRLPGEVTPEFWDWFRKWLGVPHVEYSTFKSRFRGWHYVSFSTPFTEPPAVVAVCSGFSYLPWQPPSLPDLKLPRFTRPDFADEFSRRFREKFIELAGDWGWLNWVRDRLADVMAGIGWICGKLVGWAFDVAVKPFTDEVNAKLEQFEDSWNSNVVYRIRRAMEDIRENLLKLSIGNTPLAVRNVSSYGCEVYAPEDVYVYVIAAGR
ncbi:MAG: hypothetical protein DRO09_00010 [Thermoprotei archaeon]|nr:MAG: hypothetical protein DRO09_00010 [Thermoprotei archaeon]